MKNLAGLVLCLLALVRLGSGAVRCDDTHECPTGNTCCKRSTGQWGCCPVAEAVCCSDGVHCCPHDYMCDTSSGRCVKGLTILPWLQKQPATVRKPVKDVESVVCDATHECPSGSTCCKQQSGQWGCCPSPQAVCCSDGVHCCPTGYTCDTSSGSCSKGLTILPWQQKQPAAVRMPAKDVEAVKCDDTHECPAGDTCCRLKSGQWGCCPVPQAVCCSDGVHCCPAGYTCDVSTGKCNKGLDFLPWLEKTPAKHRMPAKDVEAVKCDDTHECPAGDTCCRLKSGQWGCCPVPQAVCCSDGVHCCPAGYTCDVSTGKCNKGLDFLPWLEKTPAKHRMPAKDVEAVKCDDTHECPAGDTCCRLKSGQWGCCPVPQAVCCSDGVHCCPAGYTCDVSTGKCNKGLDFLPWLEKTPAKHRSSKTIQH